MFFIAHDPEKHALGLDPVGGNRFSEKIMQRRARRGVAFEDEK